jgi:hypothetical protein
MKVFYVSGQGFTGSGSMHSDEGKVVTRMVIAPDGNGYAITNDAKTFIRFTTGKKPKITPLGSLVDDPSNNGISIHNNCSSYGGDMIADDKGNLYILSARNSVFIVSTETKVAKYLGGIQGLPANFTVNGAVVNAKGALLVSSAVNDKGYYVIDPKTWRAELFQNASSVFKSSDLANSNFLSSSSASKNPTKVIDAIVRQNPTGANFIQVYPNPVVANKFTVQFSEVPQGYYTLELTDVMGRAVQQQRINILSDDQTQLISIPSATAKGIYLIKVYDESKKSVFEQKVMVQ